MGGLLKAEEGKTNPIFLIKAEKDPLSANLDRIQILKGWLDSEGNSEEKIYNVAWSGDRSLNLDGSLSAVGDTVDSTTGSYTNAIGAPYLRTTWRDPDFDADQPSFYYVRVLEIPTARHALLDAIALGIDKPTEGTDRIQERAYSSPIWYTP